AAAAGVRHGRCAGLDAATGVFCADRAGRIDADRKHRVSLSRRIGARNMRDTVTPSEAAIHLDHVSKVFTKAGADASYRAGEDIKLAIRPGQLLALLGE